MRRPVREIQEALMRRHGVIGLAAQDLGVSPRTLARHIKATEELQDTLVWMRQDMVWAAVEATAKLGMNGNWRAMVWWLETFARDRGYGVQPNRTCVGNPGDLADLDDWARFSNAGENARLR